MTRDADYDRTIRARASRAHELRVATAFLTRLPVGRAPLPDDLPLATAAWAFPLVGAALGVLAGAGFAAGVALGLGPWLAALAALGVQLLATGALHEDGLADVADGFGGGAEPATRLAIMRDSRIGSYGVCALGLALAARAGAMAALAEPAAVLGALVAAGALSRAVLPLAMRWPGRARTDGLAVAAGRPGAGTVAVALLLGLAAACALAVAGSFPAVAVAAAVSLAAMGAVAALARSRIGGLTGDVLGAAQQAAEVAVLCAAVALL